MLKILHGSDLHFGKPFSLEAGEAFRASAERLSPDVIVLSGDFTQRAKVQEYRAARDYLHTLPPVPLVVTPGNHDVPLYRIWERAFSPLRNYKEHISQELDTVTNVGGATVVSLNSTAPLRAIVNGRIGDRQLRFAARAFAAASEGDLRVVVAHHHMAPAPDYESDQMLPGYQRCLDAFLKMRVDLILGGHLHRAYVGNSLDVYPGGEGHSGIVILHSGTTTSRRGRARERGKNSFNLIGVGESRIEVDHFMYFKAVAGFAPFSKHVFPRGKTRYLDDPVLSEKSSSETGMGR